MATGSLKWGNPVTEREIKCLLKRTWVFFFFFTVTCFYSSLRAALYPSSLYCPVSCNTSRRPWIQQRRLSALCGSLRICSSDPPCPLSFQKQILPFLCFAHFTYPRVKFWPVLFRLSSHHAVAFFPRRYVTFITEQGPVILRLTTDPLPGSSLASHTLNSHFLDTWAIRLSTNITDTWRQPAAEDRPGWQR